MHTSIESCHALPFADRTGLLDIVYTAGQGWRSFLKICLLAPAGGTDAANWSAHQWFCNWSFRASGGCNDYFQLRQPESVAGSGSCLTACAWFCRCLPNQTQGSSHPWTSRWLLLPSSGLKESPHNHSKPFSSSLKYWQKRQDDTVYYQISDPSCLSMLQKECKNLQAQPICPDRSVGKMTLILICRMWRHKHCQKEAGAATSRRNSKQSCTPCWHPAKHTVRISTQSCWFWILHVAITSSSRRGQSNQKICCWEGGLGFKVLLVKHYNNSTAPTPTPQMRWR